MTRGCTHWYILYPKGQDLHCPALVSAGTSEYLPAGHAIHWEADVIPAELEYLPIGQGEQSDILVRPISPPYVPSGHGPEHVDQVNPETEPYLPRGHATQPSSRWPVTLTKLVLPAGRYDLLHYISSQLSSFIQNRTKLPWKTSTNRNNSIIRSYYFICY